MRRPAPLAVLLLVLAGATGCTDTPVDDDARSAHVGEVFPDELSGDVQGHHSYVVVPGVRYDFTVSAPAERMDTITAGEHDVDDEAGNDVRFVGITWDSEGQLGDTFAMAAPGDVARTLSLLVDGEPTEVGDLATEGFHGAYVAVPAEADDIGLALEYDGLVQTVEDAYDIVISRPLEPADLYHEVPRVDWRSCPEDRLSGGDERVSFVGTGCSARVSSPLPYYGPLGWAPAGSSWVVAEVSADPALVGVDLGDDYVDYEVTSRVGLTLGGQAPVELLAPEDLDRAGEQEDGGWAATAVFRVDETGGGGPLTYVRRYVAVPEDDDAPAAAPERIRRTQRVGLD